MWLRYSGKQVKKIIDENCYIPGCSLNGSSRDYNESVFSLAEAFGLKREQVPDWNYCGAIAAHNLDRELSLALPTLILSFAEPPVWMRLLFLVAHAITGLP
jgi:heterodisulfide reductase subunit B